MNDEPYQSFDLVFEHTLFCAIPPARRDDYAQALRRWLKPGGLYLAVNYMITNDNGEPPFSTTTTELDERFGKRLNCSAVGCRALRKPRRKGLMNEWKLR
ncbi:MAG: hypothetical protein Ct9H300mP7_1470 [Verrucomicrobiota bacterium]|nr:MAG: hypothetical protein Ct9H300mP7_1470 [Verrucomicrobiota bacterium]